MKYCIKLIILLCLSLFLVSCGTNDKDISESGKSGASISSISKQTNSETEADNKNTNQEKASVTINCYYDKPAGFDDKNAIIIERELKNDYVEVIIKGKVKEFEYLEVEFDADKNEFIDKGLKAKYSSLENKTVYIETNLPEGMPSEIIRWKSEKGKEYEYVIMDYGLVDAKDTQKVFILE